jgi:3',5'-cyclic AMP phosphodiesterase CpdA
MYSGAQGYYGKGLKAPQFSLQNNTSYFAIQGEKWIIIGLDSAYYDKSDLFMNGALTDANQINFIKGLNTANKTVIVLTHHNPTNIEGTGTTQGATQLPLWNQTLSALGRPPDYWYGVKARCAGHGAIPFGVAWGLQNPDGTNKPSVEYFAHELLSSAYERIDLQQTNRVLNGFAMLTIGPDTIKEEFIDQTGAVRWSQTTAL